MNLVASFDLIGELLSTYEENFVKLIYDRMSVLLMVKMMINVLVLFSIFSVKLKHVYVIHQIAKIIFFVAKYVC